MKKVRRDRERWQPPEPLLPLTVFQCRRCSAAITPPLILLTDTTKLSKKIKTSRVPTGHYWPVTEGQEFAATYAVALVELIEVGYHTGHNRLLGCCGPSGHFGRNRICVCGWEVGTERADCIWPEAVYLDKNQVVALAPIDEPTA
jgi:hypothetical protein